MVGRNLGSFRDEVKVLDRYDALNYVDDAESIVATFASLLENPEETRTRYAQVKLRLDELQQRFDATLDFFFKTVAELERSSKPSS